MSKIGGVGIFFCRVIRGAPPAIERPRVQPPLHRPLRGFPRMSAAEGSDSEDGEVDVENDSIARTIPPRLTAGIYIS